MADALEGIRVLDLTRLLPGPWCTMMLGDLGAGVIKVEEPIKGDYMRWLPPLNKKESIFFLALNRNKKSITLNLKHQKGKELFLKLVETADVVVESFRPGVMDRLGLGYTELRRQNPRIILCSISGFGQDGPYKDMVGHDINYIGYAGVLGLTRDERGVPVVPGVQMGDIGGGALMALTGILTALLYRERGKGGQHVDVSMTDGMVSWLSVWAAKYLCSGEKIETEDMFLSGYYPFYNIYETKDGKYITLGALEKHFWDNLCEIVGREDFKEHQYSKEKRGEILSYLKKKFKERTLAEWLSIAREYDVCLGPVNTIEETFNDPQILHRGMKLEIDHPVEGKLKQIGIPIKFSDTPGRIKSPPPLLGEHTDEILTGLGLDKGEIEELRSEGVV